MTTWTHKVTKSQRAMSGGWFRQSVATFADETSARTYAEQFAAEQRAAGVVGTVISVLSRKAFTADDTGLRTQCVVEHRV
jgi:hypothetical protein